MHSVVAKHGAQFGPDEDDGKQKASVGRRQQEQPPIAGAEGELKPFQLRAVVHGRYGFAGGFADLDDFLRVGVELQGRPS